MAKIPLWSSASLGSRLQHQFFYALVRLRLLFLASAFIYVVVLWYTAKPSVRARSQPYLSRVFRSHGWWTDFAHSYRLNLNFAFSLLDKAVAGINGQIKQIDSCEQFKAIEQVLAKGQGLILLTAHFGSQQSAMARLTRLSRRVNLCLYKDRQDIDRHYFEYHNNTNINIIRADQAFGGTVDMLAALKRGEVVCFVGDRRLYASDPALAASFLGNIALFPYMPYVLAAKAQCPIAIVFLPRMGLGAFKLHLAAIFKVDKSTANQAYQRALSIYVKHLEEIVKKFPYQFFVFFDMWSKK